MLLSAVALAAGLLSSQAQNNVYSLNIVGYVNIPLPYSLNAVANQLNAGTNRADQVVPYLVGDNIQVWSGVSWTLYGMDDLSGSGWVDGNGADVALENLPVLSPGKMFFYGKNSTITNITLVGNVPTGTNNVTMDLALNAVASPLPYGGNVQSGPIALPIVVGDNVQTWNGAAWVLKNSDDLSGTGWTDSNGADTTEPSVNVGQGFFYGKNGSTVNWTQILNP